MEGSTRHTARTALAVADGERIGTPISSPALRMNAADSSEVKPSCTNRFGRKAYPGGIVRKQTFSFFMLRKSRLSVCPDLNRLIQLSALPARFV